MQHVINRQIIELTLREADAAFRLQQQVSNQFHQQVLPILERVFDALAVEGELISFDRLIIDMGSVPAECMEDGSWTEELYARLIEQAEAQIREGSGRRTAVRRPRGAGIVEQWLYYMRTGHLPWNLVAIDRDWLQLLLEHLAADHGAVAAVREALVGDPIVSRRIVGQHDGQFLVSLAEVLTARDQSELPAALAEMRLVLRVMAVMDRSPHAAHSRESEHMLSGENGKILWTGALRLAAEEDTHRSAMEIIIALLEGMALSPADIGDLRERLAGRLHFCDPVLEKMATRSAGRTPEAQEIRTRDEKVRADGQEVSSGRLKEIVGAPGARAASSDHRVLEEGIFVPYAGLVLLHPFLSTFLTRVGLVKDSDFFDEAARERSLHLLHYLGTGETGAPEYELVMARVLCGFPPEEPVTREFELTPLEVAEAEALLDACLSQWTVLKNTSRAGLRANFLNRNGKLYTKEDRLRLEVERSSIDVLLDHLPWNLSLVRLPWMKEILFVNWR